MLLRAFIIFLVASFSGSAHAQIQIHLKEFAEAASQTVKLSDVATVNVDAKGIQVQMINDIVVATMVHLNQPLRIEAKQLDRLVARQQPALRGKFQIVGAESVSVTLPGHEISMGDVIATAKSFLQGEFEKQAIVFEIQEGKSKREAILVPKGTLSLSARFLGKAVPAKIMHVAVEVFVNDKKVDQIPVALEIAMSLPVLRLTHTMTRGEPLSTDDYEITQLPINRHMRVASLMTEAMNPASFRLRRNLAKNSVLYVDNFEPIPLVARNQKVIAEVKLNGIMIENTVLALADGNLGQRIKVAESDASTMYFATVIGQGRVEVK